MTTRTASRAVFTIATTFVAVPSVLPCDFHDLATTFVVVPSVRQRAESGPTAESVPGAHHMRRAWVLLEVPDAN